MAVWLAFPVAGYIGWAIGGRVDAIDAALVGGAITGAGLGAVEWWAAKGALGRAAAWIGSSAIGYAAGMAAGAALVGYNTDLGALAVMGLVSGAALGAAQGLVLARQGRRALALPWALAMPVLFALGWSVASATGIGVDDQFTVFGAGGALVFTLLTGILLARFTPARTQAGVMDAVDHVVLGAGAVGMVIAEALARRDESVRVVNRSGLREPVAGVHSATGDVTDAAFAASATRGARVVYQALNPPYHRWAQEFPGLQAAAIAAAQAADARLVVMDNVYMYGRANGRPFTEDRTYDPHTRKGRVRAAMSRALMAAHDTGRVQITVGRASDFFGPRAGEQSLIGDWVIPPAFADKPASVMGDPDMPHTYTFIPDIGENLVRLGERDDALGRVWHLPSPETRTTRDVVGLVYQVAGTEPRLKVTPAWQMRALGLVNRTVREISEMRYEFDEPFIVDASRAESELGLRATPLADAVEQTGAGTARRRPRGPPRSRESPNTSRPGYSRPDGQDHNRNGRRCRPYHGRRARA
jgi:nucleoside-diphosphate-sugar epimerase